LGKGHLGRIMARYQYPANSQTKGYRTGLPFSSTKDRSSTWKQRFTVGGKTKFTKTTGKDRSWEKFRTEPSASLINRRNKAAKTLSRWNQKMGRGGNVHQRGRSKKCSKNQKKSSARKTRRSKGPAQTLRGTWAFK